MLSASLRLYLYLCLPWLFFCANLGHAHMMRQAKMDVTWTLVYTILAIVAVRMLLAIAAFVNRVRHIEQMPGPKFKFPQG